MKPITVRAEWTMVLIFAGLTLFFELVGVFGAPRSYQRGDVSPFSVLSALTWWLGHAMWVSMDRRRRGLEVGGWRFAVVFFGFLAAWAYMVLEYGPKGFLLILLSIGIYLAMAIVIVGTVYIAAG